MADQSGLVAAVRAEARRHLTFEELESCLQSEDALDSLGRQHLHACDTCRRELTDLRAFESLPASAQGRARQVPRPEPWWRMLSPRLAGAAAALAIVAVVVSRFVLSTGTVMQVSVQLGADRLGATAPPTTLRPGDGVVLPSEVQLAIARARLAAEKSREPQTIEVRVERRQYNALLEQLDATGAVAPGARSLPLGKETETVRVQLTILPVKSSTAAP